MMNADAKRVVTGRVRMSYTHLITPRVPEQGGEAKYSVTLLIPKSDVATKQRLDAAIQASIAEGVATRWNGARPAQPATPIHDGDGLRPTGEAFSDECRGHWVMTASSKNKPEVIDANMNPIIDATQIYSGMYGRVSIRFFPYMNSGKKGIGCGLNNVQKLEDGEPLGGRTTAADDFGGSSANYAPAPQYQQPVYQPPVQQQLAATSQPQYQAQLQQQYQQVPAPQYQQPVYQPPVQPTYQQPVIDPLTGMPVTGGIMGL
jgi:hypothetical protein